MYAISFDLDIENLTAHYPGDSHDNAYASIRKHLESKGFTWTQGSLYFGGELTDAVDCVLAVQGLAREFGWFAPSVRDIRMLRIEDNNDLSPAITTT